MTRLRNSPTAQQIYLSIDGFILDSCDSLFKTKNLRNKSLIGTLPVLESCLQLIFQSDSQPFEEFLLPCVHLEIAGQKGMYDLQFMKVLYEKNEAIFWIVTKRTKQYLYKRHRQQVHHNAFIDGALDLVM